MGEQSTADRTTLAVVVFMIAAACTSAAWPDWYGSLSLLRLPWEIGLLAASGYLLAPSRRRLWIAGVAIAVAVVGLSVAIVALGAPVFIAWLLSQVPPQAPTLVVSRDTLVRGALASGVSSALWGLLWFLGGASIRIVSTAGRPPDKRAQQGDGM